MINPERFDRRFTKERKYNIKQLWEVHHEIVRQVALGRNNQEIGEDLDISPQMVSNVRNSPLAKERIEVFKTVRDAETVDLAKRIYDFVPKAMEVLERIIDGREEVSPALRAKYASVHLSRAGFGEVKKVTSISTTLTKEDIEKIKSRSLDAIEDAGIYEGEFQDLNLNGQ